MVGDLGPLVRDIAGSGSAIIYCPTRKVTEKVADELKQSGVNIAAYHAGFPEKRRTKVQEQFSSGAVPVVAATCAFGMGINKANVRVVAHYGWPQSLEQYHQEAGRAGRDGLPSDCVLFANLFSLPSLMPPSGKGKRNDATSRHLITALSALWDYAMRQNACREQQLLRYFAEGAGECGRCDVCRAGGQLGTAVPDTTTVIKSMLAAVRQHGTSNGWKAVYRQCCDDDAASAGRNKQFFRGLGRLLRDGTAAMPPLLAEACPVDEIVACCRAGLKIMAPVLCRPKLTPAGEAWLRDPKEIALVAEADMAGDDLDDEAAASSSYPRGGGKGKRKGGARRSEKTATWQQHRERAINRKKGGLGAAKGNAKRARAKCYKCGHAGHRPRSCVL